VSIVAILESSLFLGFIGDRVDVSHLHFLGTSAIPARIVLEYWRMYHGDDFAITLDSTGFEVGSQYRSFFNPLIHGLDVMVSPRDSKSDDKVPLDTQMTPCSCSVCAEMERELGRRWAWDDNTATEGVAMNMHNLNILLDRHRMVQSLVEAHGPNLVSDWNSDEMSQAWKIFDRLFSDEQLEEIVSCMEFIDLTQDVGYEEARDEYVFASKYDDDHDGPLIRERRVNSFMG